MICMRYQVWCSVCRFDQYVCSSLRADVTLGVILYILYIILYYILLLLLLLLYIIHTLLYYYILYLILYSSFLSLTRSIFLSFPLPHLFFFPFPSPPLLLIYSLPLPILPNPSSLLSSSTLPFLYLLSSSLIPIILFPIISSSLSIYHSSSPIFHSISSSVLSFPLLPFLPSSSFKVYVSAFGSTYLYSRLIQEYSDPACFIGGECRVVQF